MTLKEINEKVADKSLRVVVDSFRHGIKYFEPEDEAILGYWDDKESIFIDEDEFDDYDQYCIVNAVCLV
jgi:hypothetical protein